MAERERKRLPIDPESIKVVPCGVLALGRDEHEGQVFMFEGNFGKLHQSTKLLGRETYGHISRPFKKGSVVGVGIDGKGTVESGRVFYNNVWLGIWEPVPETANESLLKGLIEWKEKRSVKIV